VLKIIAPVTNRVLPIVLLTTKQLVFKDFAIDPNPHRLETALI